MASDKAYGTGRRKNQLPVFTLFREQVKSRSIREILMIILDLKH